MMLHCSSKFLAEKLGAQKMPVPLLDEQSSIYKLEQVGIVVFTKDGGAMYWHVDPDARRQA